ncbi:hypothetical protein ACFSQW_22470 [Sphingobacterium tabacisoli]|uniref:Uncharacterized protein n=1 Tax=Sphingobacterium tabacisoli TaxID=2044855 RepID=A0ABW5LAL0_9SPHI
MNKIILEKIEELTLYIIQQDKDIEQLEQHAKTNEIKQQAICYQRIAYRFIKTRNSTSCENIPYKRQRTGLSTNSFIISENKTIFIIN